MKKLIVLLMVCCLASSVMVAWEDDFESCPISEYPDSILSPWEADGLGYNGQAIHNVGYGGSKGALGSPVDYACDQWRPTDGEAVSQVYGKVYVDSGVGGSFMGVFT